MLVRKFESRDQAAAHRAVTDGLGEHFGFIDESFNPDLDDIDAHYLKAGHVFLIAESEGQLVGTAGLMFEEPGVGRVVRMSVVAPMRRKGVASALLDAVIEEAQSRALDTLVALTQPEWDDAIGFYLRAGFEPFDEDEVDVHLRLDLKRREQRGANDAI